MTINALAMSYDIDFPILFIAIKISQVYKQIKVDADFSEKK